MSCREQKLQFKELVEVKFHEWLLEMGHRRELDSLIPPTMPTVKNSQAESLLPNAQGLDGQLERY